MHTLGYHLREDFAIPQVAIRLWSLPAGERDDLPEFAAVSQELQSFTETPTHPLLRHHRRFRNLDLVRRGLDQHPFAGADRAQERRRHHRRDRARRPAMSSVSTPGGIYPERLGDMAWLPSAGTSARHEPGAVDAWLAELAGQRRQSPYTIAAYRRDLSAGRAGATLPGTLAPPRCRCTTSGVSSSSASRVASAAASLARMSPAWRGFYRRLGLRGEAPQNG